MNGRATARCVLVSALVGGFVPQEAGAQAWSVDLSMGQTFYDSIPAEPAANNLVGSFRYDARRGAWVYTALSAPLRDQDQFWGAFGTGGRFTLAGSETGRVAAGLELGGYGFLFRDPVTAHSGTGGTVDAIPFVGLSAGAARVELRGGWRGHALTFAGATQNRGVFETGARLTHGGPLQVQAEMRWVRASEGDYPFLGGSLVYGGSPLQAWVQAGKWLSDELAEVGWNAGLGYALSSRVSVWASVQQEPPDPLYWNISRRTWSVGLSSRLGRIAAPVLPAARIAAGQVVIRVPLAEAPTPQLWIAGSFNNWQPQPMQREGEEWLIRLPLASGVYDYAFRSADGEWFVPASIAGRRDDGMGGQVAMLVVP